MLVELSNRHSSWHKSHQKKSKVYLHRIIVQINKSIGSHAGVYWTAQICLDTLNRRNMKVEVASTMSIWDLESEIVKAIKMYQK